MTVLVALADTHGYHRGLEVPPGDVLIHAGDLTLDGTLQDLEEAVAFLTSLPHRHKVLVAGNHDACFQRHPKQARAVLGAIHYLQDEEVNVAGLRLWGSPWTPEFGGWPFMLPRGAALAERWARIPRGIDVLVTHGPPQGVLDDVGDRREGCEELLARVLSVQPSLHLFGHIHEARGTRWLGGTLFANVSTGQGDQPAMTFEWPLRAPAG